MRELILTRHRHRKELLHLLFQLGFYAVENRSQAPTETVVGLQQVSVDINLKLTSSSFEKAVSN